jgi:membrane-associated phospholipid phosphatase
MPTVFPGSHEGKLPTKATAGTRAMVGAGATTPMPFLLLLIAIASSAGIAAALVAWHYPRGLSGHGTPTDAIAEVVEGVAARRTRLRRWLRTRGDPASATGLALSIALGCAIGGGIIVAMLALLMRSNDALLAVDSAAARWGSRHASTLSQHGLDLVTQLGDTSAVVALAILLVVVESIRAPSRFLVPFLVTVMLGNELITTVVKDLGDRARPTFNPIAEGLGPSFPSGHSSTAAAFFAAAALIVGRRRGHLARTALAGGAVAVAVAVAVSRVLLDVHWVSDVVAGLALGWAWFAVCAIAFGGRLLRFGASAERARDAVRAAPIRRSEQQAPKKLRSLRHSGKNG